MANITYSLIDDFDLKGVWWLPENPELHISGVISFKNGGKITLDLIGSFRDLTSFGTGEFFQPEIILGITDNGKICTLYRNFETKSQMSYPGFRKSIFESQYLFIGKHFNAPSEIKFSSIQANFTNLENWICQRPFKTDLGKEEHTLTYKYPAEFEVLLPEINTIIKSTSNFNTSGEQFKKAVWEHTAFLKITPDQWQDFHWYWSILYDLNNLLTLFVGETIYLKRLKAFGDDIQIREDLKRKETIDIFFTQKKPNLIENIHFFDMILPLPRIHNDISSVLQLWFSKSAKLRSVYDLFFGTFYNPSMYLQFHFLALTQALESFHRVTTGGKYLTDTEWKPYKDSLTNCIPGSLDSSHKQSLKNRIKYGNEYSLRKRMKDMIDTIDKSVSESIMPSKNYYSGVIVDTRNYLTHYDQDLKEIALDGNNLFHANQRLKILVILLLLKEIGVNDVNVIQVLRENRRYKYILDEIKKEQQKENAEQSH